MTFEKLLAEIRAQRGRLDITQADLAEAAGIAPATFTRRIAGGACDFTIDELLRICNALDVSLILELDGATVIDTSEAIQHTVNGPWRRIIKT